MKKGKQVPVAYYICRRKKGRRKRRRRRRRSRTNRRAHASPLYLQRLVQGKAVKPLVFLMFSLDDA
jgi:hypothetical protein